MAAREYAGLSIFIPTANLLRKSHEAEQSLIDHTHEMLELMGVSLLSMTQLAYLEKSKGGVGSDGITWDSIQFGSWLARQRRAGRIIPLKQKKGTKRKDTSHHFMLKKGSPQEDDIYDQMINGGALKQLAAGKKSKKSKYTSKTVFGVTRKDGSAKDSLRRTISPAAGGYQIGIDTGLQLNSLMPGRTGDTGANLLYSASEVVIRAAMHYGKHFDKRRAIFPAHLPKDWLDQLQALIVDYGGTIVEEIFKEEEK